MRPFTTVVVRTNPQPTVAVTVTVDLKLNGISGTAARRLAIINNRTFEANEEGAVSTPSGPVRIRCLEIKDDSVLVQIGGEQRVLRLRPGF
jgi:type II secretory pathway component PulC